jgi:hypothetical protein
MRRQAPNSADPLAELVALGMLLPGRDADHYRLRRMLQIVYPADPQSNQVAGSGPLPIVVLQHGAHAWIRANPLRVIESYKGMRYLQDALAALGIVSVSVDTNAANVYEATLIEMRAELVVSA